MITTLTSDDIFGDTRLWWGKKHPQGSLMREIWAKDPDFLIWGAGLTGKSKVDRPIPNPERTLIELAFALRSEDATEVHARFERFKNWQKLALEGDGLAELPRPTASDCLRIFSETTLLGFHSDLDGIFSAAAVIRYGGAFKEAFEKRSVPNSRLVPLQYNIRSIGDYTTTLNHTAEDVVVIVDFQAHPDAALTIDHHTTTLSMWEFESPLPHGIYDVAMPSCPQLLATYCHLDIPTEVVDGSNMIDGARYESLEQAHDLDNPYVALNYALGVDTSPAILKKVVLQLAEAELDPKVILSHPTWEARVRLLKEELKEQREYLKNPNHFKLPSDLLAVVDTRYGPYPGARFRYLPFEIQSVLERPYLIAVRNAGIGSQVNLGLARNPFFADLEFFNRNPHNLGAIAKRLGKGGGRKEAAVVSVSRRELEGTLLQIAGILKSSEENLG